VVRADLPLGVKPGARQGAGEFKQRKWPARVSAEQNRAVGRGLVKLKRCVEAKALLHRVELFVKRLEIARRSKDVARVGQLPQAQRGLSQGEVVSVKFLGHSRHLYRIERLNVVVGKQILQ